MLPSDPQTALAPGAPEDPSANPMVTIDWSPADATYWKGEIDRANARRKVYEPSWEKNLAEYAPDPTSLTWGDEINPGIDFFTVEQKKAQLFFDTPTVLLTAKPNQDPGAIAQQQERLNDRLGPEGINASRLMDKVLIDVLCPAGEGWIKIGYTNISQTVPIAQPTPYAPLGTTPPAPQMQTAQVPVFEEVFAEHLSPRKGLKPTNFHDTEFDKAPWLGMKFTMPLKQGRRQFKLPDDFNPKDKGTDQVFKLPGVPQDDSGADEQISGVELEYKASLYDDAELHPLKLRQLVLIDGIDEPVVHRDLPSQTFEHGQLTPDSQIGFSYNVITIRDLSDSAFVSSDCTIIRPLVNEIKRFRTQLVEHRDASTSVRIADGKVITTEILSKIVRSPYGAILMVEDYDPNRPPIMEVGKPSLSRENFQSQEIISADLAKVTSISANQSGTEQDNIHSATEIQTIQRNADVRMQKERNRVIAGFLAWVKKFDTLLVRYPSQGQQKLSLGRYSYTIKPDSGMHMDVAADRKFAMEAFNFFAKDRYIEPMELRRELLPLMRLDPTKLLRQPPEPSPPEPKTSIIVKGDDLSPLAPQYANVIEILKAEGMQLTPTPITPELMANAATTQAAQQPHPGTPPLAPKVNQHGADRTGEFAGAGGLAGGPH